VANHPLAPLLAKLDRADESLSALDDELARLSKGKPLKIGIDVNFQTGWNTAYIEHAEPLPASASVLIGENLYHGRSALEHLVWALVKANHKKPGKDHTFPLWDKRPTRRGSPSTAHAFIDITKRKQLAGVPIAAITLIESLEPYNGEDPPTHFLSIINRMARDDRHHALHGSYVGGRALDIEHIFRAARGYRISEFDNLMRDGKGMVRGTKLARFRVTPLTRNPKVGVEGNIPVFIAFGDRRDGVVLISDFKRINTGLRQFLGSFEQFL
jgi:hypothetical protein